MIKTMTIRYLTIFLAVAEYGTMSAAAKHLYLSQPTVSQAIREMEQHYHGLLFERFGKKLYLTERGKLLLSHARDLVSRFEQLDELMLNQGQNERFRLGTTLTVGTCLAPALIGELEQSLTGLEVYSFVSNTHEIEEKLLKSELDAAVVEGEIQSPDLVVIPIIEDCLVLGCGSRHPFFEKIQISNSELNGQCFAMREQGSGTRQLFEDYVKRHHISIRVTWEANCPRTIINAVIWNKVLSVMSLRLLTHELAHEKIRVFYDEKQEWNRKFKLVYHKNKFLTPAIYELEKILYQHKEMKLPKEYGILAHE